MPRSHLTLSFNVKLGKPSLGTHDGLCMTALRRPWELQKPEEEAGWSPKPVSDEHP